MKVIGLATLFSMLFNFSAFAETVTVCKDINLELEDVPLVSEGNYENFNFTIHLPVDEITYPINALKDSIDPIGAYISYIKIPIISSKGELLQSGEAIEIRGERRDLLKVKVLASGTIGSPRICNDPDDSSMKLVSKTKWVQFHFSAHDQTSSFIRKAVNGTDGVTEYGICTEYSQKRIKK